LFAESVHKKELFAFTVEFFHAATELFHITTFSSHTIAEKSHLIKLSLHHTIVDNIQIILLRNHPAIVEKELAHSILFACHHKIVFDFHPSVLSIPFATHAIIVESCHHVITLFVHHKIVELVPLSTISLSIPNKIFDFVLIFNNHAHTLVITASSQILPSCIILTESICCTAEEGSISIVTVSAANTETDNKSRNIHNKEINHINDHIDSVELFFI
jgi:hypothetical protein